MRLDPHYFALLDEAPLNVYTPVPVFSLYRHEERNNQFKQEIKSLDRVENHESVFQRLNKELLDDFVHKFEKLIYRRFIVDLIGYNVITVYPDSSGDYNPFLEAVAKRIANKSPLKYYRLIDRQPTDTQQKDLNTKQDRYDNTAGCLCIPRVKDTDESQPRIASQNIIVIDDVVTSGASLTLAARKLIAAGAKNVAGASLTMTGSYKNREKIKSPWLDVTNAARSIQASKQVGTKQ